MAVCQELGIENELIPRIATTLGGGMAGTGEVCGLVSGALMCIGIRHGREEATQSDEEAYGLSRQFLQRFRDEMGHIRCRDLTGVDFTIPGERENFRSSEVPMKVCLPAAGLAYRLVLELLGEPRREGAGG
jgi:C_GCAxxG_C_C family probable redox protein